MARHRGAVATLVPPNFSTTNDGSTATLCIGHLGSLTILNANAPTAVRNGAGYGNSVDRRLFPDGPCSTDWMVGSDFSVAPDCVFGLDETPGRLAYWQDRSGVNFAHDTLFCTQFPTSPSANVMLLLNVPAVVLFNVRDAVPT